MKEHYYPNHFHVVKESNGKFRRVTHGDFFEIKNPITIFDRLRHPPRVDRKSVVGLAKRASGILI